MAATSTSPPRRGGRKADVLEFIKDSLKRTRVSPSVGEISAALSISRTRVKTLIHQLAQDKSIERGVGQRAISVPGLFDELVLQRLIDEGWVVNPSDKTLQAPCPQGHLPIVAILEHRLPR